MHRGRIAFALFDNDNVLLRSKSYDNKTPFVTTRVTKVPALTQTQQKEVPFDFVVKNSKAMTKEQNKFIFEDEIVPPQEWIKEGAKEAIDKATALKELSKFKLAQAEIQNVRVTDD